MLSTGDSGGFACPLYCCSKMLNVLETWQFLKRLTKMEIIVLQVAGIQGVGEMDGKWVTAAGFTGQDKC